MFTVGSPGMCVRWSPVVLLAEELGTLMLFLPLFHRYVSCVLGCPYEGKVSPAKVAEVCAVGPGLVRVDFLAKLHACAWVRLTSLPQKNTRSLMLRAQPTCPAVTSSAGLYPHLKVPARFQSHQPRPGLQCGNPRSRWESTRILLTGGQGSTEADPAWGLSHFTQKSPLQI